MFGYLRPLICELQPDEKELFEACYCGLCHSLGKNYGLAARFILNYEFVFLAMLLWGENEPPNVQKKHCIASPFRKKTCCSEVASLNSCAGYSLILYYHKLRDNIIDEPFLKSLPHRLLFFLLSGAYKKAARDFQEFDKVVSRQISNLALYESSEKKSLDEAADNFAKILRAAVPECEIDSKSRPMREMLYHLGRWIYIIDACDDYQEDKRNNRYNAVAAWNSGSELSEKGIEQLIVTLKHSNNLVCSAFELLPDNTWASIIRNMIYLSMPNTSARLISVERNELKTNE
jgi:hypothetical protein